MSQIRQLILDTETTGLDPARGHRIIEFAALEMINREITGNYLHLYINPECKIAEEATKIHGISDSDVADSPVFNDVAQSIIDYIKDSELIIHNAKFDLSFLDYQFKLSNFGNTSSYISGVVDTLAIARQKFPGSKNSLDALCDRFKVDRSIRDFHGALIDCRLLSEVYLMLTREQISLLPNENDKIMNIENYKFKKYDTGTALVSELKILGANQEELEQHKQYLKRIMSKFG